MINWTGIGNNALTLLVLGGIGYMIYLKMKGKSSKIGNIFSMGGSTGFLKYKGGLK